MGKNKIEKTFNALLESLAEDEKLISITPFGEFGYVTIEKIPAKEIMDIVGGGYGEYLNEPQTMGAYLIKEMQRKGNTLWMIETTIPKRFRKMIYIKGNRNIHRQSIFIDNESEKKYNE